MLPYLAMDVLGHLNGLPGLLVATIYSAALRWFTTLNFILKKLQTYKAYMFDCFSTISAGMNALAAVCITDFIRPAYLIIKKKPIDERVATVVTKSLGMIYHLIEYQNIMTHCLNTI